MASAVEPTRSLNSTVTCRRSASGAGAVGGEFTGGCSGLPGAILAVSRQRGDRLEKLPPMTERNPELLKILLGQIGKDVEIDVVGG